MTTSLSESFIGALIHTATEHCLELQLKGDVYSELDFYDLIRAYYMGMEIDQ